jgi:hypothetical protein
MVVLAALPLLYLLSVPAVLRLAGIKLHPLDVQYRPREPEWVRQVCAPYIWTMEHTALREPLDQYAAIIGTAQDPRWKKAAEMRRKLETLRKRSEVLMKQVREMGGRWKLERNPFRYPPRPGEENQEQEQQQTPSPGGTPKPNPYAPPAPPRRDFILPPTIREPRSYQANFTPRLSGPRHSVVIHRTIMLAPTHPPHDLA